MNAINNDKKVESAVWKLFVSINIVLLNLTLIVGITSVCESVSNEANKILQNFNTLQFKKGVPIINELSISVHSVVSNMKFSAYGFFTINYNMLCGFVAGLITYLVIFIQFNSISGDLHPTSNRESVILATPN